MKPVVVRDNDGDPATVTVFKDLVELETEVGNEIVYLNFSGSKARELADALNRAADVADQA